MRRKGVMEGGRYTRIIFYYKRNSNLDILGFIIINYRKIILIIINIWLKMKYINYFERKMANLLRKYEESPII